MRNNLTCHELSNTDRSKTVLSLWFIYVIVLCPLTCSLQKIGLIKFDIFSQNYIYILEHRNIYDRKWKNGCFVCQLFSYLVKAIFMTTDLGKSCSYLTIDFVVL